MKKSFVFAAVAAVALASCTNEESSIKMTDKLGQSEVAIYPFSKTATRGFVTGNEFFEWKLDELRKTDDGSLVVSSTEEYPSNDRTMQLSVYNEVGECDLFIGKTFSKEEDGNWHATPHIYYPVGYDSFDFLAYSLGEKTPFATWNGAKEVTLEVTKDCLTDDILYAGGVQQANTHRPANMMFNHAQAWLTTCFTVDADSPENVLQIKSVTWQDVYASGKLNIKFNKTAENNKPDATWNFYSLQQSNVEMPDRTGTKGCYNKYVTKTPRINSYLDMLIPAQPKQSFVIEYTLGEGDHVQTYEYTVKTDQLTTTAWEMGKHYIYNIQFSITEITTTPTVTMWEGPTYAFGVDTESEGNPPLDLNL